MIITIDYNVSILARSLAGSHMHACIIIYNNNTVA